MSEKKDDNQPTSTDVQADVKPSTSPSPTPPSKPSNSALSGIALLVAVAAAGLSGFQYYQNYMAKQQDSGAVTALSSQVEQLTNTTATTSQQLKQLTSLPQQAQQLARQADALSQQQAQNQSRMSEELAALSVKINQLGRTSKADWSLAEAEYLIRLANQRLLLDRDVNNALALLTSADQILAGLKDPLLFDTRKAITSDIQKLKTIEDFDLEGHYLQLAALYDQVMDLPQREPSSQWQAQSQTSTPLPDVSDNYGQMALDAWEGLKSLVVINYNQKPVAALLPAEDYQHVVTAIQMQLDIAQVALIKGEDTIYAKSLERAAAAVSEFFDPESQTTIAFMTTLTALQQVDPTPQIPLPRPSLEAMKALMLKWNQNPSAPVPEDVVAPAVDNDQQEAASL